MFRLNIKRKDLEYVRRLAESYGETESVIFEKIVEEGLLALRGCVIIEIKPGRGRPRKGSSTKVPIPVEIAERIRREKIKIECLSYTALASVSCVVEQCIEISREAEGL